MRYSDLFLTQTSVINLAKLLTILQKRVSIMFKEITIKLNSIVYVY